MLFRARTTLSDRPGSLATLARHCGEQGVNILGLQIFPGVEGVTDELVLRAPGTWGLGDVAELIEGAGGTRVTVGSCTEHALVDGPIQYLHGLRRLAHDPHTLAEVLGRKPPTTYGPFAVVELDNDVSLDFINDPEVKPRHYAFLVSEPEFDEIFGRIRSRGLDYWADPFENHPGEINTNDGGRGVYWKDPNGHMLEIITRPYGG